LHSDHRANEAGGSKPCYRLHHPGNQRHFIKPLLFHRLNQRSVQIEKHALSIHFLIVGRNGSCDWPLYGDNKIEQIDTLFAIAYRHSRK
jgi:hypothetical protein